jgi:hypothetical protein
MEQSNGSRPLGHYTIVGNPFLLQSRLPLSEIGKAGATSAS